MTDILFIHPGDHTKIYQSLAQEFSAIVPPVWGALLADYIRRKGYSVVVHDVNVQGFVAEELLQKFDPRLIVIMVYGHNPSASTQTMPAARYIARSLKEINPDCLIAMGGTHPSALPRETLQEEMIDFVIQGEGAYTIASLMEYLQGKLTLDRVSGVWFKQGKEIAHGLPPRQVDDLDGNFCGYAWDLLPALNQYRAHNMHCFQNFRDSHDPGGLDVRSPYAAIYTSLGCPYSCDYCCINAVFLKPSIRYWSVDTVISWIDALVVKHHVRNIRIEDELFVLSPARVEALCTRIIERGYDCNFWAYARVDTISEPLAVIMKKAGFNWICLGIESANDAVRRSVNKRISVQTKVAVNILKDAGINVLGNYMFGLPEDTIETMEETLAGALDLNCEYVNFYCMMAYPGSKLYTRARDEGRVSERWEAFAQLGPEARPLANRHLSERQILQFRDEAFHKYFTNPGYRAMILDKFGPQVDAHLTRMLALPLQRTGLIERGSYERR